MRLPIVTFTTLDGVFYWWFLGAFDGLCGFGILLVYLEGATSLSWMMVLAPEGATWW